ncbi:MAG: phosphatidate cytidylyltransferase [Clostridium sp.]
MKSDNRYLGAAMIAPFIIFIFLGGIWLKGFTFVISLIGLREFYNALKVKQFKPVPIVGYGLLITYYLMDLNFEYLMYLIVLATFILLIIPVVNLKYNFIDVALSILGFIYVGVMFSFMYLVNEKIGGAYLVWLIFIGSWLTDTSAYYAGRMFGKTKLCPEVSPKKTVEGSLGGMLGAAIGCGVFGLIVSKYTPVDTIHFVLIGTLCGAISQFGDLVASSIKRYVGIKDYSNLIPGHGGILDRFDSIIFSSLVVFYYLTFIVRI